MTLTDESHMPFGKYVGQKMISVPASYLLWFKDNVAPNMSNQNVHDYINDNINVLKKEVKC